MAIIKSYIMDANFNIHTTQSTRDFPLRVLRNLKEIISSNLFASILQKMINIHNIFSDCVDPSTLYICHINVATFH